MSEIGHKISHFADESFFIFFFARKNMQRGTDDEKVLVIHDGQKAWPFHRGVRAYTYTMRKPRPFNNFLFCSRYELHELKGFVTFWKRRVGSVTFFPLPRALCFVVELNRVLREISKGSWSIDKDCLPSFARTQRFCSLICGRYKLGWKF